MLVSVFNNYVYVIPMASRQGPDYVKAYKELYAHYRTLNMVPKIQRLDNETSTVLTNYLQGDPNVSVEYVPPQNHRTNKAEGAIKDAKNHYLATMATADPDYPADLWDEGTEQLNITLNLLRPYALDSTISAYEGMHGKTYDFNKCPMAPFDTKVLIHDSPESRRSWQCGVSINSTTP